ncbi:ATP-binding protein [Ereboglobus sp. PH5-5]|uniref:ATP-binding protein n=1 Tax=Ereboglobus sp. PH5-5 TaxID=2940529 RepID=UPI002405B0FC|nr:ATP-binding protein [Ereboglobus sp. PH5-5]
MRRSGEKDVVELTPNPAFLIQSLRCIGYTLETALADIIDNSITAEAKNISIQFRWNDGNPWLSILDDGCGMPEDKLHEAMRFGGNTSPSDRRAAHDLGRFGLGLKTASLSQCRRLTVVSKNDNKICALEWDVDYLAKAKSREWCAIVPAIEDLRSNEAIKVLLDKLDKGKSGTFVLWRNMEGFISGEKQKIPEIQFNEAMSRASGHISHTFHLFIEPEKNRKAVNMDFNGNPVKSFNPFGSAIPARRELTDETITIQGAKIVVQPFVLPHFTKTSRAEYEEIGGEDGYRDNQGFYIYRNKRLIVKGTWFRLTAKTELTKLLRVRVDIPNSLDHLWQLDVKKSQAHPPQVVLTRLKEVIRRIADEGRRVYTRRGRRTVSDTVHIWEREIVVGKASYILNENHPFVKSLVGDSDGNITPEKVALLRVISGAFPVHTFHLDANNDNMEIVSAAKKEETLKAVANLIRSLRRDAGMDEIAIKKQLEKTELPLSADALSYLIQKEFYV